MSTPSQNGRIPAVVDPQRLARQARQLVGIVDLGDLQRLPDLVEKIQSPFKVDLRFLLNDMGFPCIEGNIQTEVVLSCQRCLEPLNHRVQATVNTVVLQHEQQSSSLPKSQDWQLSEGENLDLVGLLEDEVILELPIIARHPQGECQAPQGYELQNGSAGNEKKPNPFEVLGDLKLDG